MSGRAKRREHYEPPPTELPAMCTICGGPARTFGYEQVPEVLQFLMGKVTGVQLGDQVRRVLKLSSERCAIAPKSGVAVCGVKDRTA